MLLTKQAELAVKLLNQAEQAIPTVRTKFFLYSVKSLEQRTKADFNPLNSLVSAKLNADEILMLMPPITQSAESDPTVIDCWIYLLEALFLIRRQRDVIKNEFGSVIANTLLNKLAPAQRTRIRYAMLDIHCQRPFVTSMELDLALGGMQAQEDYETWHAQRTDSQPMSSFNRFDWFMIIRGEANRVKSVYGKKKF